MFKYLFLFLFAIPSLVFSQSNTTTKIFSIIPDNGINIYTGTSATVSFTKQDTLTKKYSKYIDGDITLSVDVPIDQPFRVVPNPVTDNFIDLHIPVDIPRYSTDSKIRVVRMSNGELLADNQLSAVNSDSFVNMLTSLVNGSYLAQIYNSKLGINRTYIFSVLR